MGYNDESATLHHLTTNDFRDRQQPTTSEITSLQSDTTFDNSASFGIDNINYCETDGRQVSNKQDFPEHGNARIPHGDPHKEIYRLRTYMDFPASVPVHPCVLARHGFLYTGHKDKVKCFSCGAAIQDWCTQDDPKLARWHFEGCKLVLGIETRNRPLDTNQPIEFVGTFTSSLPNRDSGYSSPSSSVSRSPPSSFGSPPSSVFGSPSSSTYGNPSSTNQETLVPLYNEFERPSSMSSSHRPLVAADDGIISQRNNTHSSPELLGITQGLNKVRIDRQGTSSQGHQSLSSLPPRPTASPETYRENKWRSKNVEGLVFASITSSSHLRFLNEELDLCNEADRIKSFVAWRNHSVTIQDLAKSGFFYLGNNDRVQCFSCSVVLNKWKPGDEVDVEHRRNTARCKLMLKLETRNVPLPSPAFNSHSDLSPEEKKILQQRFPCLHPVNPHMREFTARLQTFDGRWPSHKVVATKDTIATAGFFFLGNNDRAKCWYCNGGLQNWEPEDDPFVEHAKWFPGCEYMLQCKGLEFVRNIVSKFPNLRRPTLKNARFDHRTGTLVSHPSEQSSTQLRIVDPRNGMSAGDLLMSYSPSTSSRQSPSEGLGASRPTSAVLESAVASMGFSKEEINRAIERQRETRGGAFQTAEQLLDAVLSLPELPATKVVASPSTREEESSMTRSGSSTSLKRSNSVEDQEESSEEETSGGSASKILKLGAEDSMTKELEELENERKCKSCFQHQADTVIIPCGHLSLCRGCSATAKKCAVCRTKIQSLIKVYLS